MDELPETLRAFGPILRRDLLEQGGLILLDGLDEVPEAEARRVQVKAAVEAFTATFPKVVMVVTSRTYAYQKQAWKLRDFAEVVLAPFGQVQLRCFVERWYTYVGAIRGLSEDDIKGRTVLLNMPSGAVPGCTNWSPVFASNPDGLSARLAWEHATRATRRALCRRRRVALLDQWESQKVHRRADGSYEVVQPSLVEWLNIDQQAMRDELNH